jgi:hypothetical protein
VPEIAAPELAAQLLTGAWPTDPLSADRFALGLLLFEAAAGRPALPPATSPYELLEQRALGRGPRARDLAHLPPYLAAAIDRLLEPRRERRAADLGAWLADMDRERRRARRSRALRLAGALGLVAALGVGAALSPAWIAAREPAAIPALELSPERPRAALPWPADRTPPPAGALLELVDASGAPLPGWRVERDPAGQLIAVAPRRPGDQELRFDARLSIDGRLRAQPAFELAWNPHAPLTLGEPRLLDPLGAARAPGAVFVDELGSLRLELPIEGSAEPAPAVRLEAGEARLEVGRSQLERGLVLEPLGRALGLPPSGAWLFEVVVQQGGEELRRSVALEVLPRPDGVEAVAEARALEANAGQASGNGAPEPVAAAAAAAAVTATTAAAEPAELARSAPLAAALGSEASAAQTPRTDGTLAGGAEPAAAAPGAQASPAPAPGPGAAPEVPGTEQETPSSQGAAIAKSKTEMPGEAQAVAGETQGAAGEAPATEAAAPEAAAAEQSDNGAAPPPEGAQPAAPTPWKLALDGLAAGEVLGPDSKPKLLVSVWIEGPTAPPWARVELYRAELPTPLIAGQLTPEAFRSEGAGWRSELTLPSPWRPADGETGAGDGSFALALQAFETAEFAAPMARLLRPFEVALDGPRLAWERPAGGLLRPGPDRSFLLGIYAHDDNGVAEVSGSLWLENGQKRELRFLGPSSEGSAALRFEPGDSLLAARLELVAQDRFGVSNRVWVEPLRVGLVPGFAPERVLGVPQLAAEGEGFAREPRPCPPMRLIPAPAEPYRFGGRSDELENLRFAESGLAPFQSDSERALPRAWGLELPAGQPGDYLLDEREVAAREFLAFLRASDGWPTAGWWPAGVAPSDAARRTALEAELAARDPEAPAVGMSFDEAAAFAAWSGKRLPTWIELEHAQRAGLEYRAARPDGPDSPWRGLSSGVAEWTATPVWFELTPAQRPASHRIALAAHLEAALEPAWALTRPGVGEFWAAGGEGGEATVDFSAALRLERGRGDPRVGLRCALDLRNFRQRAGARLAALAEEAGP